MSAIQKALASVVAAGLATVAFAPSALAAGKTGGTTSCTRKCTTDTTPPTVSITSPAAGAAVSGSISVNGSAADNVSVAKVEVQVDGGALQLATGTASWSLSIATTSYQNGSHTIAAKATDTSGNSTTASVTVTVSNSSPDTTPPSVSISAPASGGTVSSMFSVAGSATDNVSVARVDVQVDSGPFQATSGTTSWSTSLDSTKFANGSHTLTARATDTSGNTSTSSVPFSVSNPAASSTDIVFNDPSATNGLQLLGRGRAAEWGTVSTVLYWEEYTTHRGAHFRDSATGASSYVALPVDNGYGWSTMAYTMTSASDLWVFGGGGPMNLRHYTLTGSPVPTSAALVSDQTFGDSDSRQGDFIHLASGGLLAVWNQQGATGPQGLWLAYQRASGTSWQTTGPLPLPTKASKQTVVQHPVDGSIWVFSDADAYGTIGAVHATETSSGLTVDWTDSNYINVTKYGDNGPDPENPDLESAADPSTGTIALAYQSNHRQMFQTSPTVVTGSYPVVARLGTAGIQSFLQMPIYVERISSMGLVVKPGETWLMYRPIDTATMTFDHVYSSVFRNGAWQTATLLGQLYTSYDRVNTGVSRSELLARLSDGQIHLFLAS